MSNITITVSGTISVGKSTLLNKLEKFLKAEFSNCTVKSNDLDEEKRLVDLDNPDKELLDKLNNTNFNLIEQLT
jgi:Ni2+-binding GTPase involved in maturation of urease and hydrogenase